MGSPLGGAGSCQRKSAANLFEMLSQGSSNPSENPSPACKASPGVSTLGAATSDTPLVSRAEFDTLRSQFLALANKFRENETSQTNIQCNSLATRNDINSIKQRLTLLEIGEKPDKSPRPERILPPPTSLFVSTASRPLFEKPRPIAASIDTDPYILNKIEKNLDIHLGNAFKLLTERITANIDNKIASVKQNGGSIDLGIDYITKQIESCIAAKMDEATAHLIEKISQRLEEEVEEVLVVREEEL